MRIDLQLKLSSEREQRRRKAPDRAGASRILAWVAVAAVVVSVFGSTDDASSSPQAMQQLVEPPPAVPVAAPQPQPVAVAELVRPVTPRAPAASPPEAARPAPRTPPPPTRPPATPTPEPRRAATGGGSVLTADPNVLTFEIRRESSQTSGQTASERRNATGGMESRKQSASSSELIESGQRSRSVSINLGAGAPVTIGKPVLSGKPEALAVFGIERNSCAGQTLLPASGGCRITIGFDPSDKGTFAVQLIVPGDRATLAIPVSGRYTIQDR